MTNVRTHWRAGSVLVLGALVVAAGCYNSPVDVSDYALGPAPLRMPSPAKETEPCGSYEDSLTGGHVFTMYCGYCHNAPSLAERPFAQYQNAATHMRIRTNMTGKEYAKLMEFLRRWHDVPPPHEGTVEPSPKRFIFGQPIPELRPQTPTEEAPEPVPAKPEEGGAAKQ
jgi:hypothetical protein